MAFTMTGAITGAAVTGLASPTYTLTADTAPDGLSRSSYVSALGGTQTGVLAHAVSTPFNVTVFRPRTLRALGKADLNGLYRNVGRNTYRCIVRKGAVPAANQPAQISVIRTEFEVPAGTDGYDLINLKASLSFFGGFMNANASGIADTYSSGSV